MAIKRNAMIFELYYQPQPPQVEQLPVQAAASGSNVAGSSPLTAAVRMEVTLLISASMTSLALLKAIIFSLPITSV